MPRAHSGTGMNPRGQGMASGFRAWCDIGGEGEAVPRPYGRTFREGGCPRFGTRIKFVESTLSVTIVILSATSLLADQPNPYGSADSTIRTSACRHSRDS